MNRCKAITLNKRKCKRTKHENTDYCRQHTSSKIIPLTDEEHNVFWMDNSLNIDLWKIIASNLYLPELASLYRTCKSYYRLFANDNWFAKHPYYAILVKDGEYVSTRYTNIDKSIESELTRYKKIHNGILCDGKYLIDVKSCAKGVAFNHFIHVINSYKRNFNANLLNSVNDLSKVREMVELMEIISKSVDFSERILRGYDTELPWVKNDNMDTVFFFMITLIKKQWPDVHFINTSNKVIIFRGEYTIDTDNDIQFKSDGEIKNESQPSSENNNEEVENNINSEVNADECKTTTDNNNEEVKTTNSDLKDDEYQTSTENNNEEIENNTNNELKDVESHIKNS